jgi:hypothetical protein
MNRYTERVMERSGEKGTNRYKERDIREKGL